MKKIIAAVLLACAALAAVRAFAGEPSEEARRQMIFGKRAFKEAKTRSDFKAAAEETTPGAKSSGFKPGGFCPK
jgi:hypothetical protein